MVRTFWESLIHEYSEAAEAIEKWCSKWRLNEQIKKSQWKGESCEVNDEVHKVDRWFSYVSDTEPDIVEKEKQKPASIPLMTGLIAAVANKSRICWLWAFVCRISQLNEFIFRTLETWWLTLRMV